MNIELLVNLHNALSQLDPNSPIAVICKRGRLQYRQLGKILEVKGLEGLYFCTKDIKLGILTQSDYRALMDNLEKLIQDPMLKDGLLETSIKEYGFEVYKVFSDKHLYGPQLYMTLKLVTFRNRLISQFILNHFSPSTKVLLKALKDEFRSSKGSK